MKTQRTRAKEAAVCMKIEWSKRFECDGKIVCPDCHMPAEERLGFFGWPVYGHVPVVRVPARKPSAKREGMPKAQSGKK